MTTETVTDAIVEALSGLLDAQAQQVRKARSRSIRANTAIDEEMPVPGEPADSLAAVMADRHQEKPVTVTGS